MINSVFFYYLRYVFSIAGNVDAEHVLTYLSLVVICQTYDFTPQAWVSVDLTNQLRSSFSSANNENPLLDVVVSGAELNNGSVKESGHKQHDEQESAGQYIKAPWHSHHFRLHYHKYRCDKENIYQ